MTQRRRRPGYVYPPRSPEELADQKVAAVVLVLMILAIAGYVLALTWGMS